MSNIELLNERYKIENDPIGNGNFGLIFLAIDVRDNKK